MQTIKDIKDCSAENPDDREKLVHTGANTVVRRILVKEKECTCKEKCTGTSKGKQSVKPKRRGLHMTSKDIELSEHSSDSEAGDRQSWKAREGVIREELKVMNEEYCNRKFKELEERFALKLKILEEDVGAFKKQIEDASPPYTFTCAGHGASTITCLSMLEQLETDRVNDMIPAEESTSSLQSEDSTEKNEKTKSKTFTTSWHKRLSFMKLCLKKESNMNGVKVSDFPNTAGRTSVADDEDNETLSCSSGGRGVVFKFKYPLVQKKKKAANCKKEETQTAEQSTSEDKKAKDEIPKTRDISASGKKGCCVPRCSLEL
nr:PREDICTED: uncharacterized protein LOC107078326 isoform X1 [Lepisosteus oculatus]